MKNINSKKPYVEVAAALIWNGNKFMICQRPRNKACSLLWEFVGGKIEKDETKKEALKRECREEIAAEIEIGEIFTEVTYEYPDAVVHLTLFDAKIPDMRYKKLEHNDIRWITAEEIQNYKFCPADNDILIKISELQ